MRQFIGFFVLAFILNVPQAFAAPRINEIMYDLSGTDTDHEWIEVYNPDDTPVDLTGWRFYDGANHLLNNPPANGGQGSLELAAQGYVIFAADATLFFSDYPSFSGTVIDTVMNLNNTTDTLKLIDGNNAEINSVTYTSDQGAAGDGNSLQYVDSSWIGSIPTPNTGNTNEDTSNTTTGGGTTVDTQKQESTQTTEPAHISTDIKVKSTVFSGLATHFDATTLGYSGESLKQGRFMWSMGDGGSRDDRASTPFDYVYEYPGEYVIVLDYYQSYYNEKPDATDRMIVKVVTPNTIISNITPLGDVELSNTSSYEVDLSKWILQTPTTLFTIPKNTIILPGKKLVFTARITHFPKEALLHTELISPTNDMISVYPVAQILPPAPKQVVSQKVALPAVSLIDVPTKEPVPLAANAIDAVGKNTTSKSFWPIIFFGFVVLALGSVIFIRKSIPVNPFANANEKEGDDITIIE